MDGMDDKERRAAFVTALTTEHFVLQTSISTGASEASSRASIYTYSLSSSLVAMGFCIHSPEVFVPLISMVIPAVFLLGVFTILRLVDLSVEYSTALIRIAKIRSYYRTLTPEAAIYFSPETGRWPEAKTEPSLRIGPTIGILTTAASMIAAINAFVAGVGVTLLAHRLMGGSIVPAIVIGVVSALILVTLFYVYQQFRLRDAEEQQPG